MNKSFLNGILLTLGILCLFGIVFAVGFHTANEITSGTFSGDYTFTGNVNGVPPSGSIMAFNLVSCPSGWKACDGTDGTLDLRGQFLRGLNDFGTGARSDGKEDIDGGSRNLGDWQNDTYRSHNHQLGLNVNNYLGAPNDAAASYKKFTVSSSSTENSGDNETRPRNVGIIYCEKE